MSSKELRAAGLLIYRIINQQIEYLLLQTSYGEHHWSPPKGHVDPGEDDFTTALRETREEAGYTDEDLKIYKNQEMILNYKVRGRNKVVTYWLARLMDLNKQPKLSEEHIDFKWLPKLEAQELCGFEDFARMVEHFDDKIFKL